MAELKPCPFCGCRAFIDVYMDTEYVNVNHKSSCMIKPTTWVSAYGDGLPIKFQVEAWNRRTANTPCDLCRFNPPSSGDGKPCTMCVANGRA